MHQTFLLAALEEAFLGRGQCAPNPSVGAVVVRQGKIIAKAHHKEAGTPHAEVLALAQLTEKFDDLVLYVTLEPCNHWGRTPPCVNAIIDYGVHDVFYAYCDPNPLVSANDTPSILAKNGINAVHLPLPEIDAFYESYRHWCQTKKPFVTAKLAQTLDGKIAQAGGLPCKISNQACDRWTHLKRKQTDVILTSAKTINQDDPLLNARMDKHYPKHVAIIDSELNLNPKAKIFQSAKSLHIYSKRLPVERKEAENIFYHLIHPKSSGLNLEDVILHLGELGYHDVWVEAGASLFAALHQADLVNRTHIYVAPQLLGADAVNAYSTNIFDKNKAVSWQVLDDNAMLTIDWRNNECLLESSSK